MRGNIIENIIENKLSPKGIENIEERIPDIRNIANSGISKSHNLQLKKLFDVISKTCLDIINVDVVFLFSVDRKKNIIYNKFGTVDVDLSIDFGTGITGWVVQNGETAVVNSVKDDPRFYGKYDEIYNFQTKNLMALPIKGSSTKVIGALVLINKNDGIFTKKDRSLATSLTHQISIAFENAFLYDELMLTFQSLVEVMAVSIDQRHPVSSGHSRRVAMISAIIAEEMGFSELDVSLIRLAGFLHDYGKISIPDSILKKEERLSGEEYEIMKEHAISTYNILKRIYFSEEMSAIPEIASLHHERWDGNGYPFGKKGEEIHIGARIIAVADVFDAMTSWREYHAPYTTQKAVEEIEKGKNTMFDPKIVDVFLKLYDENRFNFR